MLGSGPDSSSSWVWPNESKERKMCVRVGVYGTCTCVCEGGCVWYVCVRVRVGVYGTCVCEGGCVWYVCV